MKKRPALHTLAFVFLSTLASYAGEIELSKDAKPVVSPLDDRWRFTVSLPAFVPTLRGDTGLNGKTSYGVTGFNELVNKIDMAAGLTLEAQKGKFGIRADFSYSSISDGFGVGPLVRKADIQVDQMLGDFGVSWRVLEGPKGYLDVIAGTRYTYNYEQIKLQGDGANIRATADRLSALGTITRSAVAIETAKLIVRAQQRLGRPVPTDLNALTGVLQQIRGTQAERADRINDVLQKKLNVRASRTDQWLDPYIGLRGRYNFNDKLYFTSRADIAPFDVGCDFGWQAQGGFGYQLTKNMTYELVYRALKMEYRHDGLIYDQLMYGPEGTLSVSF